MNRDILLLCFALILLNCKGQQTQTASKEKPTIVTNPIENYLFNTEALLKDIKELSSDAYEGRRTGTIGAEKSKNIY